MNQRLHRQLQAVWGCPPGLAQLTVVNHSNVGRRFLITGFCFFAVSGLLAMLIRTQLALPDNDFVDRDTYNQLFTLHGTTMMFLFAVPAAEGLAMYLVPKMIGSRDLVFPRLSAYGYWCYLGGGLLLYSSLLFGAAPDGGWFMYTPLSGPDYAPGKGADFWLMGVTLAEVSAICGAVELISSILITRAPGMRLQDMPVFVWAMLVVSTMILFGFPPLILGSVLLELERAFGLPFFSPAGGGDPLLWQHLFWLFGHPEVYIIFLPAAGILSTLIPVFARRPLASYTAVVVALVATGFLSFGLWVHHMYAVGIPYLALSFFSAASMAITIPTGMQVFTWIATLWRSRPRHSVPMLYVYGFFFIFVLGGLTGVMVALVPFDLQVHDTHFVVAHLHYVLIGGLVFPLIGGIYYWLPHFSGRRPSARLGRVGFYLMFIGFNLTFLMMHLTGLLGMPRRIYLYSPGLGWDGLNLLSSVGGFLLAIGTAAFFVDVLLHLVHGRPSRRNPWQADTLEWAMPLPPPAYNFASIPHVRGRNPLWRNPALGTEQAAGAHYLGHDNPGRREILGTSVLYAQPRQLIVLPGNTWAPLLLAALTALVFIGMLAGLYWLTAAALLAVLATACDWARRHRIAPGRHALSEARQLPLQSLCPRRPGWWGTLFALAAAATTASALLFGYLFYWTATPQWPPANLPTLHSELGLAALLAMLLSSAVLQAARRGEVALRRHRAYLASGALLLVLGAALAWAAWSVGGLEATRHAYDATLTAMLGMQSLFMAASLAAAVYLSTRAADAALASELGVLALLWHYTVAQGLFLLLPALILPGLA
ncbi:cytochrome c oxidase subunit I [Alkalilimnicola sp. S0819]|uniref:cytochrome c oxidase subunit I n=1 Tax=Alkalilimnicola sp. S0819 TaxID=2613922 RepID=UPI0012615A0D|nr:cytochrome c oxidase subunit I [Alkalilimnicola sp. S0819]KAB7623964.1 cytochrome c oxidase subunit I [Alkalilimnicola sp. S0819]MPQ16565.1 cytochrome c oxidase subunit I [Alkalilimnicola sp. S0819]